MCHRICLLYWCMHFVTSRLDFCNSLYFNMQDKQLNKLQSVLNAAAKFLTGRRKFDSTTAALQQLHWLSVKERITFKICTIAYHLFHGTEFYPQYFSHILPCTPPAGARTRASYTPRLKCCPDFRPHLKSYGERSISFSAVRSFNSVPLSLRSVESYNLFKSGLKTHLYM